MTANSTPLASPTAPSLPTRRIALAGVTSLVASARTVTVSVWVPALPPIEATIGMSTASATICSMVASNCQMTVEATIAVPRLTRSQAKRRRVVFHAGSCRSVSLTPPRRMMSSSASSSITPTTSSTVTTPISRPESSTTGAETSPYWWKRYATSSWSISAGIVLRSGSMISLTSTGRRVRIARLKRTEPVGTCRASTTKMS